MDGRAWWATIYGSQRFGHYWVMNTFTFFQCEKSRDINWKRKSLFNLLWSTECEHFTQSLLLTSCLQSFPSSGSFPINQLFESGGQSIGASASAAVLPMNIQGWDYPWLTNLWFWHHVKNVTAPGNYLCYLLTLFSPFQLSRPLQLFQALSSSPCGFIPPSHFCPLTSPMFPYCLLLPSQSSLWAIPSSPARNSSKDSLFRTCLQTHFPSKIDQHSLHGEN